MTVLDILNTTEVRTRMNVCRIMQRVGDARVAEFANQFPHPMLAGDAYTCLEVLRLWHLSRGFEVRESDIRARDVLMNAGFVATLKGKFIASFEIVEVKEQP